MNEWTNQRAHWAYIVESISLADLLPSNQFQLDAASQLEI